MAYYLLDIIACNVIKTSKTKGKYIMQTKSFLSLCAVALISMSFFTGCDVDFNYGHRGPGWHWGHGGHGGWHRMEMNTMIADVAANSPVDAANALVSNYGIRLSSAQTIIDLAGGANQEQTMSNLGISAEALAPLATYEMPSKETIKDISYKLTEDSAKIEKILSDFISDIKAEDQK